MKTGIWILRSISQEPIANRNGIVENNITVSNSHPLFHIKDLFYLTVLLQRLAPPQVRDALNSHIFQQFDFQLCSWRHLSVGELASREQQKKSFLRRRLETHSSRGKLENKYCCQDYKEVLVVTGITEFRLFLCLSDDCKTLVFFYKISGQNT